MKTNHEQHQAMLHDHKQMKAERRERHKERKNWRKVIAINLV